MLRPLLTIPWLYATAVFVLGKRVVVKGWSMHPALAPGERVLVDPLAYRLAPPRRGDIVLAAHPWRPGYPILKRVIALPRDRVRLGKQGLWVNNELYARSGEPEIAEGAQQAWELAPDEFFLVGDALDHSTDSRHFGPLPRRAISGRAWLVYWPLARYRRLSQGQPIKTFGT